MRIESTDRAASGGAGRAEGAEVMYSYLTRQDSRRAGPGSTRRWRDSAPCWACRHSAAPVEAIRRSLIRFPGMPGGPRTKSSLSTGHRHISSYSSPSSSDHQPSRAVTGSCRAPWYCRSRARQLSRSCLYRSSRSRCRLGRAGRLGDVGQGDGTAAPAARASLGEPVLGEHPQRGRRRRRAQPGRPGDLGAACFRLVKHLIDES